MTVSLTLQLSDELSHKLLTQAQQRNLSLESLILQSLEQFASQGSTSILPSPSPLTTQLNPEQDPLLQLIGTLHLGTTDLGENHDAYIGQALLDELNPHE